MFTKITAAVAVATVTATASARVAGGFEKRNEDQDASATTSDALANKGRVDPFLADKKGIGWHLKNVDGQGEGNDIKMEEKPLKNQQRRQNKVFQKVFRSDLDLGILVKDQGQKHRRELRRQSRGLEPGDEYYNYYEYDDPYFVEIVLASDNPSEFSVNFCQTVFGYPTFCGFGGFPITIEYILSQDEPFVTPAGFGDGLISNEVRLYVVDTDTFPCGASGGMDITLWQLDRENPYDYETQTFNRDKILLNIEGILDGDDTGICLESVFIPFDTVPTKASKSTKAPKSTKSTKAPKSASPSASPYFNDNYY